jgi:hypothetical protein
MKHVFRFLVVLVVLLAAVTYTTPRIGASCIFMEYDSCDTPY